MTPDKLSENFWRSEFACRCCGLVNVDPLLVDTLEDLRFDLNAKPITILCGCRCPRHNTEVGGADKSEHLTTGIRAGRAADIRADGVSLKQLYLAATAAGAGAFYAGGVGIYPDQGFLHVDVRGQLARWGQIGRKKVPFMEAWEYLLLKERREQAGRDPAGGGTV